MLKISGLLVFAALAAAQITGTSADRTHLVAQCRQEAYRGHLRVGRLLPAIGPQVDQHRARMASICGRWQTASAATAAPLLQECLTEAASGPRIWHRGRDLDRDHVLRLKKLCLKLADASGAA